MDNLKARSSSERSILKKRTYVYLTLCVGEKEKNKIKKKIKKWKIVKFEVLKDFQFPYSRDLKAKILFF